MRTDKAWEYCYLGFDGEKYPKEMTLDLALRIRHWRIDSYEGEGCSWRGVATSITCGEDSNQLLGMGLCQQAMKFFGETEKDGWN